MNLIQIYNEVVLQNVNIENPTFENFINRNENHQIVMEELRERANNRNNHQIIVMNDLRERLINNENNHQELTRQIRRRLRDEPFSAALKTTIFNEISAEGDAPGSYKNYLTNWSIMKNINSSLYAKLKILSRSILLSRYTINSLTDPDLRNNFVESTLNSNSLNTITQNALESQFLFIFIENLPVLKELLLIKNLSIDSECLIYMSLLVRVCFTLTPRLGLQGLNYYSENLVEFKSFKQKILTKIIELEESENRRNSYFYGITKKRVFESKFIKPLFLYSLSGIAVGGLGLLVFKKEPRSTVYEHGKLHLARISQEIGSLYAIIVTNFWVGFLKTSVKTAANALVISIKTTIQEFRNTAKNAAKGLFKGSITNNNNNNRRNNW